MEKGRGTIERARRQRDRAKPVTGFLKVARGDRRLEQKRNLQKTESGDNQKEKKFVFQFDQKRVVWWGKNILVTTFAPEGKGSSPAGSPRRTFSGMGRGREGEPVLSAKTGTDAAAERQFTLRKTQKGKRSWEIVAGTLKRIGVERARVGDSPKKQKELAANCREARSRARQQEFRAPYSGPGGPV